MLTKTNREFEIVERKVSVWLINIEHTLKTGENIIEFTPDRSGVSYYNCWMGMIQGKITIQE